MNQHKSLAIHKYQKCIQNPAETSTAEHFLKIVNG